MRIDWIGFCFKTLIISLLTLWLASFSYADEVVLPIRLVVVQRADITVQQQIDLFYVAASRLSEVGVTPKILHIYVVNDIIHRNDFSEYIPRLFKWSSWAKKHRIIKKGILVHFLLPPITKGPINYGGGVAGALCSMKRVTDHQFSYSIIRLFNSDGLDRTENSMISTIHELLHGVGAKHIEEPQNVMRPYFTPGDNPILEKTKQQVASCMRIK